MKALVWEGGELGAKYHDEPIPADMAKSVAEYRQTLLDTALSVDDAAMEEYFEKGDVSVDTLKRCIKAGTHLRRLPPGAVRHRLQEQGRAALARRRDRLPAEPDRRARHQRRDRGRRRGGPRAPSHQGRPGRAVRRPRVQDHQRQIRHADLRARLCRHPALRRHGAEHDARAPRAHRADVPDARRQARRDQGSPRRRHRRLRRPQGHRNRRHARLGRRPGDPGTHGVPGARHRHLGRAAHQGGASRR